MRPKTRSSPRGSSPLKDLILEIIDEKKTGRQEERDHARIESGTRGSGGATLVSLDRDKYVFWRDLFAKATQDAGGARKTPDGVFYYGKGKIDRFLQGMWRDHAALLEQQMETAKAALPEKYPFIQIIADKKKIEEGHVFIRGDRNNRARLRRGGSWRSFRLSERKPFTKGSGRLELAEAIAEPRESADRAGVRESRMDASLRSRHCGDPEQLRPAR